MGNKVKFVEKQIIVNGNLAGWLEGSRSEVWVILLKDISPSLDHMTKMSWDNRVAVARFKYGQPTAKAKKFIKWSLEKFSAREVIEGCQASSPYGWAASHGFDPLNARKPIGV